MGSPWLEVSTIQYIMKKCNSASNQWTVGFWKVGTHDYFKGLYHLIAEWADNFPDLSFSMYKIIIGSSQTIAGNKRIQTNLLPFPSYKVCLRWKQRGRPAGKESSWSFEDEEESLRDLLYNMVAVGYKKVAERYTGMCEARV